MWLPSLNCIYTYVYIQNDSCYVERDVEVRRTYLYKRDYETSKETYTWKGRVRIHRLHPLQGISTTHPRRCATLYIYIYVYTKETYNMAKETCNSKILVDIHRWQPLLGTSTTRLRFCATLYTHIQKRLTTWQKGPVIQKYLSIYVAGARCRIWVQRTWALRNIVYIYTQKRPTTWQKRPII